MKRTSTSTSGWMRLLATLQPPSTTVHVPGCEIAEYWLDPAADVEIHHFIGKDIAYFHTLFWPEFGRPRMSESPPESTFTGS